MNLNPIIAATAALQRLDGVAGVLLFKGANVIHKQMPFSETRSSELREALGEMLSGYREVRRKIRLVCLEFDAGLLLTLVHNEAALAFLLTTQADPDLVASAGLVLLEDHAALLNAAPAHAMAVTQPGDGIEELIVSTPRRLQQITEKAAPVVNHWGAVRKALEGVLGKVMGRAQAVNLVDRVLVVQGVDDPWRLTQSQIEKLTHKVLDHIPNTAKRRQLGAELHAALEDISPEF